MKRSSQISLVILGGATAALFTGCGPASGEPRVTTDSYYSNNHFIPGAGYYHAPFRAFYPIPYNRFDQDRRQYYYNGRWESSPYESIVNVSSPSPEAAQRAESARVDIQRRGFGSTGRSQWIHS